MLDLHIMDRDDGTLTIVEVDGGIDIVVAEVT